ncbi:hypothetical protein C8J57DRAFT_193217 [Mycena rebaudengoi]|nr:hypothetical protein C8J57DRAFT_193217 [Mycena rebaudengoi]
MLYYAQPPLRNSVLHHHQYRSPSTHTHTMPPTNATIPQAARHAVFENCQNTTISGGVINLQVNTSDSDEYDFPTIKLGHLELVEEVAKQNIVKYRKVLHKKTRVVKRHVPEVVGVRRIHLARVHGSQEDFTAVVYEGSDFEKHRAHAEQREEFRHPSLIQLFGVTSSTRPRLNALIYHDGLIPLDEFRQMHQQSLLGSAYVEYEFGRHFFAALNHWDEVTGKWLLVWDLYSFRPRPETGTMLWIRSSTGQLCIEVSDSEENYAHYPLAYDGGPISSRVHLTSDINLEDKLLSNMSLHDIHHIFCCSGWRNHIEISDPGTILLGSLSWPTASCVHQFNPFSEISLLDSLGLPDVDARGWEVADSYVQGSSSPHEGLVILPNGWTRVALADLPINEECHLLKRIFLGQETGRKVQKTWLSQANNIMDKAGLDADEYYLLMHLTLQFSISSNADEFTLQGTFMANSPTDEVYLFLFPANVANSRGQLAVHLPLETETYYWSFDPNGIEHLPQDYLDKFALPSVRLRARVAALHWSQELYDSIATCHRAKGFDPASQDVAIELGYLLLDVDRLNDLINGGKIEAVDEVEMHEDEI